MALKHLTYTATGRTFDVTDKEGKPTGQKTYKGGIGQVNVLDGKEYKPYVWADNVCKFNKYEFRLVAGGVEIWEDTTKIVGFGVHPEIENELIANEFERKTPVVSGLATRVITNEDSADRIEISYDVATDDFKSSVTFEMGGARGITFGYTGTAKVLDKLQRTTLEFDQKAALAKPTIGGVESQKYIFDDKKSYWTWLPSENVDHKVILNEDKTEVCLKEKIYTSLSAVAIKPDTWGPTAAIDADDGFETDDTTWSDDSSGYLAAGKSDLNVLDAGLMWTVTDTDLPGATINTGTKLTIDIDGAPGSGIDGVVKIADDRSPGTWGSANRPSQLTKHPDTVDWDLDALGVQDSPDLAALVQARIDGNDVADAFVSGDKIAIIWEDVASEEDARVYWPEGDADLTIVYTAAGGGAIAPTSVFYGPLVGPMGGPL